MEKNTESLVFGGHKASVRKKIVLFIDDNLDALELLTTVFENDFEIFTAQSGQAALELLSEMTKPDLILLDFHIGDMTGQKFLLELEKERPDLIEKIPVVFLTGMDLVPASKAVGIIRKPYELDQLKADINHFIGMTDFHQSKNSSSLAKPILSPMILQ